MTRAYLIDGEEVEIVETLASGFVVRHVYEHGEDQEEAFGKPKIVEQTFEIPPTRKQHEIITTLEELIVDLSAKVGALQKSKAELERGENEIKESLKRLKKYPGIAMLEDALEGRITHFIAMPSWHPWYIVEIKEARKYASEMGNKFRLESEIYDSGTSHCWRIPDGKDLSGDMVRCQPVAPGESALEKMQSLLDIAVNSAVKDNRRHDFERYIKIADANGLLIADDVRESHASLKADQVRAAIQERRKELAKAEAELAAITSKAATAQP